VLELNVSWARVSGDPPRRKKRRDMGDLPLDQVEPYKERKQGEVDMKHYVVIIVTIITSYSCHFAALWGHLGVWQQGKPWKV